MALSVGGMPTLIWLSLLIVISFLFVVKALDLIKPTGLHYHRITMRLCLTELGKQRAAILPGDS